MAISTNGAKYITRVVGLGVRLGDLLTVGRLGLYAPKRYLNELSGTVQAPFRYELTGNDPGFPAAGEWADDFYRHLGAKRVRVLDGSDYEGADLVHNLNCPLPPSQVEQFDCVLDGGTLEHVFNVPEALTSYMKMVRPGGHLVLLDMPATNCCGHGFYQFSPALFWQVFAVENGFEVVDMILCETKPFATFWQVRSPAEIGRRVELIHDEPCHLYICARKVRATPDTLSMPIQDDYARSWNTKTCASGSSRNSGGLKSLVQTLAARIAPLRYWSITNLRNTSRERCNMTLGGRGTYNPYSQV